MLKHTNRVLVFVAAVQCCGLVALAQQSSLISRDPNPPSPDKVEALQFLQKESPIYVTEKRGPWEAEVGGPLRAGAKEIGLQAGYASTIRMGGTQHNYGFAFVNPRFGYVFTDLIGDDVCGGFLKGNGEVVIEGLFGDGVKGGVHGATEGLALNYKHNFITGTRFVPFVELGLGLSMNQWHIYECQSDFEFITQIGAGCQYFFTDDWALIVQARWHHMSNAGMTSPNPGLNDIMSTAGLTHFF
ncbi:MAG: acyloxyacyl hydrolase [Verrucomicrobia bacterium]|nr:acyloxyacyl hydrolase [Verrucomicrobiota bacterium]